MLAKMKALEGYRVRAYFFLLLGLVLSLGGNLASAHLNGHRPGLIEYGIAAVPPLVVFGMIEILVWTPWPDQRRWQAVEALVAFIVAGPAAVVSYIHLFDLTMDGRSHTQANLLVAALTPLMIDGMLAGSTFALLVKKVGESNPLPQVETLVDAQVLAATKHLLGTLVGIPGAIPTPVEKPVEKSKPRRRLVTGRQRHAPQDHPVWPDWIAANREWTPEQMLKALQVTKPDASLEAARQTIKRWRIAYDKQLTNA